MKNETLNQGSELQNKYEALLDTIEQKKEVAIKSNVFALNSKLAETEMAKKFAPEYNFVARHIPTPEAREFVSYALKNKAKNKTIFALADEFYTQKNMNCYFDAFVAEVTVLLDRLKIKVEKA